MTFECGYCIAIGRRRLRAVQRAGGWQQLTPETRKEAVWVWAWTGPHPASLCIARCLVMRCRRSYLYYCRYLNIYVVVKTYTAALCKFIVVTTVNIIINIPIIIEYKYMSEI